MNKLSLAIITLALTLFSLAALAQAPTAPLFQMPDFRPTQTTTDDKRCINVTNLTQHTITGDFVSDQYEKESEWGTTKVSNRHKFKIARNETQGICPNGPYFAGPSIEFVIRRAWPVFRCHARLGIDLKVTSTLDENNGETFSANCN